MKQHINKIIILTAIIFIPMISFGQYCNHFHEKYCEPSDNEMFKLIGHFSFLSNG